MWLLDRLRGPPIDFRSCSPPPSKQRRISSNMRVASRLVTPEVASDSAISRAYSSLKPVSARRS